MKQKITVCSFAKHTIAAGLLFPAAVCLSYIWGLVSGRIETAFRYDMFCLIVETAKVYACCAVVAIACACLAQYLYRARS